MSSKPDAKPVPARIEHDDSPAVTTLIAAMVHPLKRTLEGVRRAILSADPGITEGIKWNSPSFYCHGWFATVSCRKPEQLDIVLHHGAKIRADSTSRVRIDDPNGLLTWPSKGRAILSLKSDADFQVNSKSFQRIIKQWAVRQR